MAVTSIRGGMKAWRPAALAITGVTNKAEPGSYEEQVQFCLCLDDFFTLTLADTSVSLTFREFPFVKCPFSGATERGPLPDELGERQAEPA